ncbi:MAG: hypothetical protein JOZ45_20450 [Acidobacteriaceae bacterium]|nr:hypothetical protein [Acidobacteriaceae bacterium]MBV9308528.1 hypothetical protein [Acidobacteriaceae bacterium]
MPKNPGRPDRKYFVGMPIPAAAGFVAAVVFADPSPVRSFFFSVVWLILLGIVSLLMVSSWRYPSFKQINISKPHPTPMALLIGVIAVAIWAWAQPVLLTMAITYVLSGILIRIGGLIKRRRRVRPPTSVPEHQIG